MKKINNSSKSQLYKALYLLTICMLVVLVSHAEIEPGGDVDEVPIDGGLSLLLAAGVGYGAKKISKRKSATKVLD